MASMGHDELFDFLPLSLCSEPHESDDLDFAMIDAEKAARIGLLLAEGAVRTDAEVDLELVRQVMRAIDAKMRHAAKVYWAAREAPKLAGQKPEDRARRTRKNATPTPTAANVVALPPRAGA